MPYASGQIPRVNENSHDARQLLDNSRNKLRELSARWDNRLAIEGQSLAKLYIEGRISLVCYLDVSIARDAMGSNPIPHQSPVSEFHFAAIVKPNANTGDVAEIGGIKQSPMLVFDVEVVQMDKGLSIPSTVWLDVHKQTVENVPGNLLFQSALNRRYKFIPAFIDGEFSVLSVLSAFRPLNVTDSQIQRAAQIVNNITEDHADRIQSFVMLANLKKIAGAIRVMLYERDVKVSIAESADFFVHLRDVLFGPFDL